VIDDLMYIGSYDSDAGIFDGTDFHSFGLDAAYVGNFHSFQGAIYFGGNPFSEGDFRWDRPLYKFTPAAAAPALAATGVDTSTPLGLAVMLLLAGAVALGIRRQTAR